MNVHRLPIDEYCKDALLAGQTCDSGISSLKRSMEIATHYWQPIAHSRSTQPESANTGNPVSPTPPSYTPPAVPTLLP